MAQKINSYSTFLFTVLVLSLGFGQLLRFDFYGVPLYFHDLVVICLLALQGLTLKDIKLSHSFKVFLLGLAIGWARALTMYSIFDILVPLLYTLRLLAYLALHLALIARQIIIPYSIFLYSGLTALIIGAIQYVLLPDMRIFQHLGWDDHLNRLTLPHFDPTFTAVMLSLFVLSLVRTRSIFNISVLLFSVIGILLTYSRSVWLTLIVVGTVYAIQQKKYVKFFLAIVILGLVVVLQPKKFGEGTNLLRVFSVESRLAHDISYIKTFKWDLAIGRGMNTLIIDSAPTKYISHATGPNNSYLYLLATAGIIGLVGWGMLMQSIYSQSRYKPMLLFFFFASLFNNVMFYPFALLWILLIDTSD